MYNFIDLKNIINGALSNIFAALVVFVLSLVFLDRKKIWAPWIYKNFSQFGKFIVNFLILLGKVLINPLFRIVIAGILLLINYKGGNFNYSILVFLILLSFLRKQSKKSFFLPSPKISDGFETFDTEKWKTKTGAPIIENNFGKPAPDLGLPVFDEEITNSFIILKDKEINQGVIECDFYLEESSLFNVIFFANCENNAWYMARFDSRGHYSDGFLIKEQGESWKEFKMSGTRTSPKVWHRARVEFNSTKVLMYCDNNLIVEFNNPKIFGKSIGMFNEVNFVHIDNFSLTEMK